MTPQTAMTILCAIEGGLWILIGFLFWRRMLQILFPAMWWYLLLQIAATPVYTILWNEALYLKSHILAIVTFCFYWVFYSVKSVLFFLVCREIFLSSIKRFPMFHSLGKVPFRWLTFVLIFVWGAAVFHSRPHSSIILDVVFALMHTMSIVSLILLAYLLLSMRAVGLSMRSVPIGISIGLAWLSMNDLIISSLINHNSHVTSPLQFVNETMILLGMCIWVVYFSLPAREPASRLSQADEFDGAMTQLQ